LVLSRLLSRWATIATFPSLVVWLNAAVIGEEEQEPILRKHPTSDEKNRRCKSNKNCGQKKQKKPPNIRDRFVLRSIQANNHGKVRVNATSSQERKP
jgi:hypothetical protein